MGCLTFWIFFHLAVKVAMASYNLVQSTLTFTPSRYPLLASSYGTFCGIVQPPEGASEAFIDVTRAQHYP